jgi:hypothetical protein
MMKIPMPNGGIFAVIEPGNIERMKQGKPLLVGTSCVCFTPDMSAFLRALGVEDTSLPPAARIVVMKAIGRPSNSTPH